MEEIKPTPDPIELPELVQAPPPPPPPPVLPDSVAQLTVALARLKIHPDSLPNISFHVDEDTRDFIIANNAAMIGEVPYNVRFPAPPPHLHNDVDALAKFIDAVTSQAPMMHNPPIEHLLPKTETPPAEAEGAPAIVSEA